MESKFTGGLLGYIGISIAQGLITFFTLGFGTPWAICLKQNWIAKHTHIDGYQVLFDGTGGQLFGNYIKWFLLSLITCGIYSFWLGIKMQQWVTKHTHLMSRVTAQPAPAPAAQPAPTPTIEATPVTENAQTTEQL